MLLVICCKNLVAFNVNISLWCIGTFKISLPQLSSNSFTFLFHNYCNNSHTMIWAYWSLAMLLSECQNSHSNCIEWGGWCSNFDGWSPCLDEYDRCIVIWNLIYVVFNKLRPKVNGQHFGDDILKCINRMKTLIFPFNFHQCLLLRAQQTICKYRLRWWLGVKQVTSHDWNHWWRWSIMPYDARTRPWPINGI